MKTLFTVIAISSVAVLSAAQCGPQSNPQSQPPKSSQTTNAPQNASTTADQKVKSDQAIAKDIQDKLSSGWFSKGFQNVKFDVRNGSVTLQGAVDTQSDKETVEKDVRKIDGVRDVNNLITIQASSANTDSKQDGMRDANPSMSPNR